jgi:hypothetical protein
MSEYVVHLTKGPDSRQAFYSILLTGVINAATPCGIARELASMNQTASCFSEIPVQEVCRLASRYSAYGLGFHHDTLLRQGGARVWYVDLDRPLAQCLDALKDQHVRMNDPADPFWSIAPYIERPGVYGNGVRYQFEWEREWRVARSDMWFAAGEIAFIFAPEYEHPTLVDWLPTVTLASDRKRATPPILDPRWPDDQLFGAFARDARIGE